MSEREGHHVEMGALPELGEGEERIYRYSFTPDGSVQRTEDTLLPRFVLAKREGRHTSYTVDELIAIHNTATHGPYLPREFSHAGVTYRIASVNEVGEVGIDSTAVALDGPNAGRGYSVDIGAGARLRAPFTNG